MQRRVKINNTAIVLIISIVFAILICSIWNLYYAVNDDVTTRRLLSGCYTGTPHPAGSLIRFPLAVIFSGLFYTLSVIDWYGLFLVVSHFICFFLIARSVLDRFPSHKAAVMVMSGIVFWMICVPNIIYFQFTTTATIYAAAGVFLLLVNDYSIKNSIPSICLLLLSLCVRKETFYMILPFVALTWLLKLCEHRGEWKKVLKTGILYGVLLGILSISILGIDIYANRENKTNQALVEFNAGRNNIRDWDGVPDYDSNLQFYQAYGEQGLSREEYDLLKYQMMTMDFSTDIIDIVKYMYQHNLVLRGYADTKYKFYAAKDLFLEILKRSIARPLILIACTTAVLSGIYLIVMRRYMYFTFLLGGFLGLLAEVALLLFRGRMPERVMWCMMMVAVLWLFAVLMQAMHQSPRDDVNSGLGKCGILLGLLSAVYLGVFLFMMIPALDGQQTQYSARYEMSVLVNEYCAEHSDNVYFSPYNFLSGDTDRLGSRYQNQLNNRIRIGLSPFSTAYYERLDKLGVMGTEEEAITTQDNVYLIGEYTQDELIALDNYFTWKYKDAYSYEVVDMLEDDIYVWKVHLEKSE